MNDEEILTTIAAVCDFDRAGVERWRTEALIIGRAVASAAERQALERAIQAVDESGARPMDMDAIRALIEQSASKEQ